MQESEDAGAENEGSITQPPGLFKLALFETAADGIYFGNIGQPQRRNWKPLLANVPFEFFTLFTIQILSTGRKSMYRDTKRTRQITYSWHSLHNKWMPRVLEPSFVSGSKSFCELYKSTSKHGVPK
jgi:hypothetical protein